MKFLMRATVMVAVGVSLAGCEKTVATRLPRGSTAYDAIAVPAEIAMPTQYALRIGDRINVAVFHEEDFSAEKVLVDTSGNVALPLIGSIHAAGLTQDALAEVVRGRLANTYLRDPRVSVSVDSPAVTTVSVEGHVQQPGVYEIMPGHTLLTAIALARSPNDRAKLDEVLIFRTVNGERMGGRFDLAEIRAGRAPDPILLPNDVVVVGYSQVRGVFQEFLKAAPLFNVFTRF